MVGLCFLLFGGGVRAALFDSSPATDRPVRLTVEITWATPANAVSGGGEQGEGEIELEVPEGQVLEAVAWPIGPGPERKAEKVWRLGGERAGKVRALVEAPIGASLLLRARGQSMRFPLPLVLEGPQRTPSQSPVDITVERVPWDVVTVSLGQDSQNKADGIVAPGARVPVSIGFNVLTPEASEVALRCAVELRPVRGGERVWGTEIREVVPTNSTSPATFSLPVQVPETEGTYILDLHASWEPAPPHDGTKLIGRLIRRGKSHLFGPATASRRVTLVVLAPDSERAGGASLAGKSGRDQEVDTIDLTRLRGPRPTASGRAPLAGGVWPVPEDALAEPTRRERLQSWIPRLGREVSQLGPADATGLAWSAVGLKVPHPERPHRLTLTVARGHPSALSVALIGPTTAAASGATAKPRLLLDACATGPPVLPDGPPVSFSWLVWPGTGDPVLVMANRSSAGPVQVGTVTLTELAEIPPGPVIEEPPAGAPTRGVGLFLNGPDPLDRFASAPAEPGLTDLLAASRNLAAYLSYCGTSAVVLPEALADRAGRGALGGNAVEDSTAPDRLDLALRVLKGRGIAAWLELSFAGSLPGLPGAASQQALGRGLVRVDHRGMADSPAAYHPLNDQVRKAMRQRVADAVTAHKAYGTLAGVLVRLGPGPTLLGSPDTGFDDTTFTRFVREAFDPETARGVPGLSANDSGRFAARAQFLAGPGRVPWLTWRSQRITTLYGELAESVRGASSSAALAVITPAPNDGPVGTEARRADFAGLAPSLAWRAVGLDLDAWPTGESSPIVLRGVDLGPDDLSHDLATHPELDAKVAARPARGLLLDVVEDSAAGPGHKSKPVASTGLTLAAQAIEDGAGGDEPLGHALAALDARWVWVASSAVVGHEERIRRFARVFRSVPATPPADRLPIAFGVAVRVHRAAGQSYVVLANDTPYPVRVKNVLAGATTAAVYDLGSATLLRPDSDASGRLLVLDLPPFGTSAVRVASPDAKVAAVTPYPSETVLTSLRARHSALSEQLTRLSHRTEKDKSDPGPPNPGFEPEAAPGHSSAPAGWKVLGGAGDDVVLDAAEPHSGRGSLRLNAPAPPASAVCDDFVPTPHTMMLVRAWLRADRPDAKVRVWIEGESAGKPYRRVSEVTVPSAWTERAIRVADIPNGGLTAARVRFELLGTGSLWVDDLSVTSEALTEPERRNARNALLAALKAFREERYADFARLSGSHWARQPSAAEGASEGAAADRATLIRTGDASALPPGRRLR